MGTEKKDRIKFLDGLRGVAIAMVVFFHAFTRWPELVFYHARYAEFSVAKYGWLGVELFFMISGFVIYMTLDKCRSMAEFISRRWLRLFPAMFVVSLLVYATAGLLGGRPAGDPTFRDLIPGLLFVEPLWLSKVFGSQQGVLEASFWSLFVEVKFYAIFGALFFYAGRRWAKVALALAFGLSFLLKMVNLVVHLKFLEHGTRLCDVYLTFQYFGWFLIGVLVYELYQKFDILKFASLCVTGVVTGYYAAVDRHDHTTAVSYLLIVLFVSSFYVDFLRRIFANRVMVFVGFISYPFYLMHENLMIALVRKIGPGLRPVPDFLIPGIPLIIIVTVSYLLARFVEPYLRDLLRGSFRAIADYVKRFSVVKDEASL